MWRRRKGSTATRKEPDMTAHLQHTTSYEGWIEDLAYELSGEYAMHGDGEPRAHSVLEDAVLEQLAPVMIPRDERPAEAGVPAHLWGDPDPAGRTRLLLYALFESLWPWSPAMGFPDRTLLVEADDRWQAHVVGMCGREGGERLVAFSEDVDLRSMICRSSTDLRALYQRLRDKIEGRDLIGALRGRRDHASYAPIFTWIATTNKAESGASGGADSGAGRGAETNVYRLCEDCAANRSVNAHEPVRKLGSLDCLAVCEDCGAVNRPEHPEGRLPVLVGRCSIHGEDDTFVLRVEFPMRLPVPQSYRESPDGPYVGTVEDEATLLRWADEVFDEYQISFV